MLFVILEELVVGGATPTAGLFFSLVSSVPLLILPLEVTLQSSNDDSAGGEKALLDNAVLEILQCGWKVFFQSHCV